jgi:hypothetical protein
MAGVAGMKRLAVLRARIEHAVANGAAAASSRIRVACLPVPSARERRHEREVDSPASAAGASVIGSSPETGSPVEWRGRGSSVGGVVLMAVDAALLDRAGELKRELVAFSRQPRYDRAFSEVLARHGGGSEVLNEHRLMMLWDYFALEHRLRNGRTMVELAIGTQRHLWEQRLAALLLGAPRHGRIRQPREDNPGQALPGGKIYLSFPGLGDRLAARVAGEIGDHPQQFGSPNALACYAGKAPVTRRSGKSELVVATRLACNRYLADAVQQWAFCSLRYSGWAREFYDTQRARGKTHHAALRALGNRWLEILWHCLTRDQLYNEATHLANRNRALGKAA